MSDVDFSGFMEAAQEKIIDRLKSVVEGMDIFPDGWDDSAEALLQIAAREIGSRVSKSEWQGIFVTYDHKGERGGELLIQADFELGEGGDAIATPLLLFADVLAVHGTASGAPDGWAMISAAKRSIEIAERRFAVAYPNWVAPNVSG